MNKMEINEQTIKPEQMKNPFDEIGGTYVKLEKDKAKVLLLTNWKLEHIKRFKDDKTGELKDQLEFSADVLNEDGKPTSGIFTTTSINAIKGLKEVFGKYWPNTTTPRLVRIKKIGEGKSTVYDIEEQKITKA